MDTVPPHILSVNVSYVGEDTVVILWDASDNIGLDHFEICVDHIERINVGLSHNYTLVLDSGCHDIIVLAVDKAGNMDASMIQVCIGSTEAGGHISITIIILLLVGISIPIIFIVRRKGHLARQHRETHS